MDIGRASASDLQAQALRQNPPAGDDLYTGQMDADIGDELNSGFGDDLGGFGGSGFGDSGFGDSGGGGGDAWGSPFGDAGTAPMSLDGAANGNTFDFGTPSQGQGLSWNGQQAPAQGQDTQRSASDRAWDATATAIGAGGKASLDFIIEFIKSFKNRNIEDWGIISNTWFMLGGGIAGVGLLVTIIGTVGGISALKLAGLGGVGLFSGGLTFVGGCFGLGISVWLKQSEDSFGETGGAIASLPEFDESSVEEGGFADLESLDDYDEDDDEIAGDDLDATDFDDLLASTGLASTNDDLEEMFKPEPVVEEPKPKEHAADYNALVAGVQSNMPVITRKMLWDTFKPFFPVLSSDFSKKTTLDLQSETALQIGSGINQAMEILFPKAEPQSIECILVEVVETVYCYEVTFSRPKTKVKDTQLAEELTNFFKESPDDKSEVTVSTVGRNFIAVIPKGRTGIVTMGDVFSLQSTEDYFLKKTFPFIAGIGNLGEVELLDARKITSMLIAGKPRSGKSSYVSSILLSMVTMNKPEDVQFIIIDPKNSMLFHTYALLPHVCGRFVQEDALMVLRNVLEGEGARRKQMLLDNGVENIWELRERKNVQLPVLYIVIDEVVSLMSYANDKGIKRELQSLIDSILTQLPSSGVGLILIPHRSTGILGPTTRMNIAYKAAVMADKDVVEEELGVKRWMTPLTKPGELAALETGWAGPKFLRGSCPVDVSLSTADSQIRELICNIARAWYKMGVELPDMSALGDAFNRDENQIREKLELTLQPDKVQYELDLDGYRTDIN